MLGISGLVRRLPSPLHAAHMHAAAQSHESGTLLLSKVSLSKSGEDWVDANTTHTLSPYKHTAALHSLSL